MPSFRKLIFYELSIQQFISIDVEEDLIAEEIDHKINNFLVPKNGSKSKERITRNALLPSTELQLTICYIITFCLPIKIFFF